MRSILLMAYQISPTKGSEYAVGWNFTMNLAKKNRVYVLCGASGDHMGETLEIENHFRENPHPNIKLVPIKPSKIANKINWVNKSGFTPAFYIAYNLWHKKAYKIAREIVENEQIDIVHHLNPIGFREPGYLWKLDKPFIWGPIGGAVFINPELLKYFSLKTKIIFFIKNSINAFQLKYNQRIRKASDKASHLVFCNSENKNSFERFLGKSGCIISEQGSFEINNTEPSNVENRTEQLNLVWAGQITNRKNLIFLFRALQLIKKRSNWMINIIGDGKEILELKNLAEDLFITNNIIWHGRKKREETISIIKNSDLHCLSSLVEGNPAVLYESVSLGIPTISLDQDGMHDTLSGDNGILIPVSKYEETIKLYAKKIDDLIDNPDKLIELKIRTNLLASKVSWSHKIEQFEKIYEDSISSNLK